MQAAAAHHRLILFFRNDLRIRDNVLLHEAAKKMKSKEANSVSRPILANEWL